MTVRLYLDAAPVIYLIEQVPILAALVDSRLSTDAVSAVVSDLTRLECRVGPIRVGDERRLREYDDFFAGVISEIVALGADVLDLATDIRARYAFKTPDAIHLAAAVCSRCDVFLTNDRELIRFPGIAVEFVA